MLERLLHSKAAVKVLGFVIWNNGFHLREIARQCGISPSEAKKELDLLVAIGLLDRNKSGNQMLFHINPHCPFLLDIKNLYQKTTGVFPVLQEMLASFDLTYSFVFGSLARRTEKKTSDIDLMIIGNESDSTISHAIFKIQKQLSREINFIHWTEEDFQEKLRTKNSFLANIVDQKVIWIRGDEDEFVRIVKERFGKKNRTR